MTTTKNSCSNDQDKETLPLVADADHSSRDACSLAQIRYYILFVINVTAWYNTNGMSGIAMQQFAAVIQQVDDARIQSLLTITAITSVVTAFQLFLGLWLQQTQQQHSSATPDSLFHTVIRFDFHGSISSALHGIGSICTNLGFMYGSASLVQIIKLVEPFEILLLTRLFLPDERKLLTVGVASSMTLTVGAAISLIQSRTTMPHVNAVVFAILSGVTLSTRNILQRKKHGKSASATSNSESGRSVLENSLIQFTQLSWQSAVVMTIFSIFLFLILAFHQTTAAAVTILRAAMQGMNWGLFAWHPLYNAFSMITLGFCSALTHSLLNAGKRVFAIVMAIVWFQESFSKGAAVGLVLAKGDGQRYWMRFTKPMIALLLLQLIQLVHEQDQIRAIT